ncbi:MAG: hypothetical protein AAFX87_16675 [Bacteroidota bacterium]
MIRYKESGYDQRYVHDVEQSKDIFEGREVLELDDDVIRMLDKKDFEELMKIIDIIEPEVENKKEELEIRRNLVSMVWKTELIRDVEGVSVKIYSTWNGSDAEGFMQTAQAYTLDGLNLYHIELTGSWELEGAEGKFIKTIIKTCKDPMARVDASLVCDELGITVPTTDRLEILSLDPDMMQTKEINIESGEELILNWTRK